MTTENTTSSENPTQDEADLLKKRGEHGAADIPRVFISTACEVLGGISRASAEAFTTFNQNITPQQVATSNLPTKLVEGFLKGNAKFFEELSHSTERVAETIKSGHKS